MKYIASFLLVGLVGCLGVTVQPPKNPVPVTYLYDNITIEIQPTYSAPADEAVVAIMVDSLHHYRFCHKNSIVTIIRTPVHANIRDWLRPHVLTFEDAHRTLYDLDKTDRHLIVFVSVLPGDYVQPRNGEPMNKNIIGIAFGGMQYIALFHNFGHHVLLHEFGHIVGLVNRSTRAGPPVNPKRPNHCNNRNCVMFWRANSKGLFGLLCLRDLNNLIEASRN